MAKSSNMKDLLKQRMSAAQQVSEMEIGNRAYESLIDPLPAAVSTIRELPVDKLRPFFTTDIGFHPYPPEKLRAFAQQLLEQGLLERIIVRSIPDSDEYEILAGHNRTAAWRMAGHDTIPAEVVVANDARAIIIATATNLLRRQELTIIERGKAYKATTSWDSGCITELYADYDMARFAMLKGIREEQAEGCVKDWAERDALEEEYCTDFYEAWHRDEYSEKHFTASIEKLSLTLPQRIIEVE